MGLQQASTLRNASKHVTYTRGTCKNLVQSSHQELLVTQSEGYKTAPCERHGAKQAGAIPAYQDIRDTKGRKQKQMHILTSSCNFQTAHTGSMHSFCSSSLGREQDMALHCPPPLPHAQDPGHTQTPSMAAMGVRMGGPHFMWLQPSSRAPSSPRRVFWMMLPHWGQSMWRLRARYLRNCASARCSRAWAAWQVASACQQPPHPEHQSWLHTLQMSRLRLVGPAHAHLVAGACVAAGAVLAWAVQGMARRDARGWEGRMHIQRTVTTVESSSMATNGAAKPTAENPKKLTSMVGLFGRLTAIQG